MIVLDRYQTRHSATLKKLMEVPENVIHHDAGILRCRDLFMLVDIAEASGTLYRNPSFYFFDRRLEDDKNLRFKNLGNNPDLRWRGAVLSVYDSTGTIADGIWDIRMGTTYEFLVRDGIEVFGLGDGRLSRREGGTEGGTIFGFGDMDSRVYLPSYTILSQDLKLRPEENDLVKSHSVDASNMYIGYNSITLGLRELGDESLLEWFEEHFTGRLKVEGKLDLLAQANAQAHRRVITS